MKPKRAARQLTPHIFDSFWSGDVVCNIGQVTPSDRLALERHVRDGTAIKWRGHWYPVAGAAFGLGQLKTCYGLASQFVRAAE